MLDLVFQAGFECLGHTFSGLEACAYLLTLFSLYFAAHEKIATWGCALASSALYLSLVLHSKLYADAAWYLGLMLLTFWGGYQWLKSAKLGAMRSNLNAKEWRGIGLGAILLYPSLYLFFKKISDSELPLWDAMPALFTLLGLILLGRKKNQTWLFAVAGYLSSVVLLMYKNLYLSAGLYAVFAVISAWAACLWWRNASTQKTKR